MEGHAKQIMSCDFASNGSNHIVFEHIMCSNLFTIFICLQQPAYIIHIRCVFVSVTYWPLEAAIIPLKSGIWYHQTIFIPCTLCLFGPVPPASWFHILFLFFSAHQYSQFMMIFFWIVCFVIDCYAAQANVALYNRRTQIFSFQH